MSQYYPPYRSSRNNIKVELDLANYATKTDLNNITHVDVSSFASKTNLAALKTEVDKIDADKLKARPADLAKSTNAIEHDVVKKTDYNTKETSIEAQIAGLTKNTVDNLADLTKLKTIDTNSFVNKTKFSADINTLDDKIDGVEKKISDISFFLITSILSLVLDKVCCGFVGFINLRCVFLNFRCDLINSLCDFVCFGNSCCDFMDFINSRCDFISAYCVFANFCCVFANFCCDLLVKSLLFLHFKFSFIVDNNFLVVIPLFCAKNLIISPDSSVVKFKLFKSISSIYNSLR